MDKRFIRKMVESTFPPEITAFPPVITIPLDNAVFTGQNKLFADILGLAAAMSIDGDESLYEMLLEKWPDATEKQYPAALKEIAEQTIVVEKQQREVERHGT